MLDKNVMPWQWDYDNYTNPEMNGKLYPDDVDAIKQIREYEVEFAMRQERKK
jgi:hypothetical protein